MRRARILAVMMVASLVAAAPRAQSDVSKDLIGRWEGQRHAEDRVDNIALVFAQADKSLSGQIFRNGELFDNLTNIAVTGNKVTFLLEDLDFRAVVDGKTIQLTAHRGDRALWSMTLTKSDKALALRNGATGGATRRR